MADGTTYDGDFQANKYHGRGKAVFPNGDKLEGEWKDEMRHGPGLWTYANGTQEYREYAAHTLTKSSQGTVLTGVSCLHHHLQQTPSSSPSSAPASTEVCVCVVLL